MKLTHDGLSLWYGTPDAPAPFADEVLPRRGASLVVAAHPANPTNAVLVRYRVDGGNVQTIPGREIRNDYDHGVQYFAVAFPPFPVGQVVEYFPLLTCSGRQVPSAHLADRFRSRFRLEAPQTAVARRFKPMASTRQPHFNSGLTFVATLGLQFEAPQFVGETPWGMRVNIIVKEGAVTGDGFRGRLLHAASDDMLVRRDGMGVVRMRAVIATDDGARLDVESGGYVDFGADGYRRAVSHDLPDRSSIVISPLISTRHPRFSWLGRVQCVGVGETRLTAGYSRYDVYAVRPSSQ